MLTTAKTRCGCLIRSLVRQSERRPAGDLHVQLLIELINCNPPAYKHIYTAADAVFGQLEREGSRECATADLITERVSAMHLPQFWRIAPAIAFTTPFSPLRLLIRSPDCTRALFRTARCLFKHTTMLGVNDYFTDNTGHMFAFKLPSKSTERVQLQTLSGQIILHTFCNFNFFVMKIVRLVTVNFELFFVVVAYCHH